MSYIDIPFECRHQCWFCGEPYQHWFSFPHEHHTVLQCSHPDLIVPSCQECLLFAKKSTYDSIYLVHSEVKQKLIKRYHKDLAIGLRWTPESLANSGFEGGNFEGFQRSAWFMYEVAKKRVNFCYWPLALNGVYLEYSPDKPIFVFDGVTYPSIDEAIEHYCKTFELHRAFFVEVIAVLGEDKFAQAVRFSRLHIGSTPQEKSIALRVLAS